jgi:hypothetical protein
MVQIMEKISVEIKYIPQCELNKMNPFFCREEQVDYKRFYGL